MTVASVDQSQRTRTANGDYVDDERLRALIAKHLDVDISRVTDDADLGRDLGADWLDRLELIILVEEIAGLEIADFEADRIKAVGDLILYVDGRRTVTRSAPTGRGGSCKETRTFEDLGKARAPGKDSVEILRLSVRPKIESQADFDSGVADQERHVNLEESNGRHLY